MKNNDIRKKAKDEGIFLYQIAEQLKLNDGNFSRKLRKEFSQTEKEKIFKIIEQLKQENN